MARTRQIDPCYPFEKEIRELSIPARYFYILSWCHMSDPDKKKDIIGGVLPHDIFFLKNNIFPEETLDVAPIVEEIIEKQRYFPFEADGKKWLWCPTMPKHQTINHPSKGKYPDPPVVLREYYRSTKVVLTQSRVELSRVEIKKKAEASPALQAAFDKVFKRGLNIYALLNRLKKESKVGAIIPEEVLIKVCEDYLQRKEAINNEWGWFRETLIWKWNKHNAEKNEREGKELKKEGPVSLKDLLSHAAHKNN